MPLSGCLCGHYLAAVQSTHTRSCSPNLKLGIRNRHFLPSFLIVIEPLPLLPTLHLIKLHIRKLGRGLQALRIPHTLRLEPHNLQPPTIKHQYRLFRLWLVGGFTDRALGVVGMIIRRGRLREEEGMLARAVTAFEDEVGRGEGGGLAVGGFVGFEARDADPLVVCLTAGGALELEAVVERVLFGIYGDECGCVLNLC